MSATQTICIVWDGHAVKRLEDWRKVHSLHRQKHIAWLHLQHPSEEELMQLEKAFGFHHLAIEDVRKGKQRAKFEDYGEYAFITVRGLGVDSTRAPQLSLFLSKNSLVTVSSAPIKGLQETVDRIEDNPAILQRGPDYTAYVLLDSVVDAFFELIGKLEEDIDAIEDKVFDPAQSHQAMDDLFQLKKKVLSIRKLAYPLRDVTNMLARRDSDWVRAKNTVYFRDVNDHVIRITDSLENYRELLATAIEAHLSVVSNNLNEVMKRLAAITVILMVPTLIASIYGMNLHPLPFSDAPDAPWLVILAMTVTAITSAYYFRVRRWI